MYEVRICVKSAQFKINIIISRYIYETENRFLCFKRVLVATWLCTVLLEICESDWFNHQFLFAETQVLSRLLFKLKMPPRSAY